MALSAAALMQFEGYLRQSSSEPGWYSSIKCAQISSRKCSSNSLLKQATIQRQVGVCVAAPSSYGQTRRRRHHGLSDTEDWSAWQRPSQDPRLDLGWTRELLLRGGWDRDVQQQQQPPLQLGSQLNDETSKTTKYGPLPQRQRQRQQRLAKASGPATVRSVPPSLSASITDSDLTKLISSCQNSSQLLAILEENSEVLNSIHLSAAAACAVKLRTSQQPPQGGSSQAQHAGLQRSHQLPPKHDHDNQHDRDGSDPEHPDAQPHQPKPIPTPHSTLHQALELVVQRLQSGALQECGARELASICWALAKLNHPVGQELQASLQAAACADNGALLFDSATTPRALANLVWSWALWGLQNRSALDMAASAAAGKLQVAGPQDVSLLLWSLATLGHRHSQLLASAGRVLPVLAGEMNGHNLANTLWALAKSQQRSGEVQLPVLQPLAARLTVLLPGMSPQEQCSAIWGLAKLGYSHKGQYDVVQRHVAGQNLAKYSVADLSRLLWAFATAGRPCRQLLPAVQRHLLRSYLTSSDRRIGSTSSQGSSSSSAVAQQPPGRRKAGPRGMNHQDLVMLIWSLGRLAKASLQQQSRAASAGHLPGTAAAASAGKPTGTNTSTRTSTHTSNDTPGHATDGSSRFWEQEDVFCGEGGLMDRLVQEALQLLSLLPPHDVARLAWACAVAQPPSSTELVMEATRYARQRLGDFSPESLSILLWACGEVGHLDVVLWRALASPPGQQLLLATPPKELVNICGAAAKLQVRDPTFLQEAVRKLVGGVTSGVLPGHMNGHGYRVPDLLVSMTWALAMLGLRSVPLLRVVLKTCRGARGVALLPPKAQHQLLWAMSASGAYHPELFGLLGRKVCAHARSMAPQQLVDVVWSYAVARHYDEEVVAAVCGALEVGTAEVLAEELVQLMWAMAYLGAGVFMQWRPPVEQLLASLRHLGPAELALLLWAMAVQQHVMFEDPSPQTASATATATPSSTTTTTTSSSSSSTGKPNHHQGSRVPGGSRKGAGEGVATSEELLSQLLLRVCKLKSSDLEEAQASSANFQHADLAHTIAQSLAWLLNSSRPQVCDLTASCIHNHMPNNLRALLGKAWQAQGPASAVGLDPLRPSQGPATAGGVFVSGSVKTEVSAVLEEMGYSPCGSSTLGPPQVTAQLQPGATAVAAAVPADLPVHTSYVGLHQAGDAEASGSQSSADSSNRNSTSTGTSITSIISGSISTNTGSTSSGGSSSTSSSSAKVGVSRAGGPAAGPLEALRAQFAIGTHDLVLLPAASVAVLLAPRSWFARNEVSEPLGPLFTVMQLMADMDWRCCVLEVESWRGLRDKGARRRYLQKLVKGALDGSSR